MPTSKHNLTTAITECCSSDHAAWLSQEGECLVCEIDERASKVLNLLGACEVALAFLEKRDGRITETDVVEILTEAINRAKEK